MVFNSYPFLLLFLPLLAVAYYGIARNSLQRKYVLLAASLIFVLWGGYRHLLFLVADTCVNYVLYRLILRSEKHRRLITAVAVIGNVLVLIIFKYTNFLLTIVNSLTSSSFRMLDLALPMGISFVTFQQIAFLVEVSHAPENQYGPLDYGLFITFFPHLSSGPIVLKDEFFPVLAESETQKVNWHRVASGILLFAIGLSKKVLVADSLGGAVDYAFAGLSGINSTSFLFADLLYTFQVYFDFSGYCDMAVGIARILGLDLPFNFNSPLRSNSINDLWHRWHITLTRFLTKYVYFSLGGSRKGTFRTYVNIMIVFLVSGLWHGASYNMVLWGLFQGAAVVVYRLLHKKIKIPALVGRLLTILFLAFTNIIFRSGSITGLRECFSVIFTGGFGPLDPTMCSMALPTVLTYLPLPWTPVASALIWAVVIFAITQVPVNSRALADREHFGPADCLFVLISVPLSLLSLSGVVHFIYAYF